MDYHVMTSQDIQLHFQLPKIAARKIEEANQCVNDPNSTIMQLLARQEKKRRNYEGLRKPKIKD